MGLCVIDNVRHLGPCPTPLPPRREDTRAVRGWRGLVSRVTQLTYSLYIWGAPHHSTHNTPCSFYRYVSAYLTHSLTHSHTHSTMCSLFFLSLLSIVIHCFSINTLLHHFTYDKTHLNKNNPCKSHVQKLLFKLMNSCIHYFFF